MKNISWGEASDNRGHLVELLGVEHQGLQAVLSSIVSEALEARVTILETICNVKPINNALRRAGFFHYRRAPFIVRSLGSRKLAENFLDHANWRVMGGDVDTF